MELHLIDGADHFKFAEENQRAASLVHDWSTKYFPVRDRTGGIAAGLLWEAASWAFTEFARISTQYAAIYSSFAIFRLFLIWALPADEVTAP